MTTKSSFRKTVEKLTEQAVDLGTLPCMWCQTPTKRATLAQYGARCLPCYEAYCGKPQPSRTANKRTDGPKAWAYALQAREESGERLGAAQKAMWRAALQWVRVEAAIAEEAGL